MSRAVSLLPLTLRSDTWLPSCDFAAFRRHRLKATTRRCIAQQRRSTSAYTRRVALTRRVHIGRSRYLIVRLICPVAGDCPRVGPPPSARPPHGGRAVRSSADAVRASADAVRASGQPSGPRTKRRRRAPAPSALLTERYQRCPAEGVSVPISALLTLALEGWRFCVPSCRQNPRSADLPADSIASGIAPDPPASRQSTALGAL
jgi:hypothetical protein